MHMNNLITSSLNSKFKNSEDSIIQRVVCVNIEQHQNEFINMKYSWLRTKFIL